MTDPQADPTAPKRPWMFWHPLPIWQVILVFVVVHLAFTFIHVALQQGLGIRTPYWAASGLAGGSAVALVLALRKRLVQSKPADE